MNSDLRIVWIPNQLKKEGRIEQFSKFERGKTIRAYLDETGFDYRKDGYAVLSSKSGRIKDLDSFIPDGGDEILIMKEIRDPFTIGFSIAIAVGASITTAVVVGAIVEALVTLAVLASIAYSIYSAFQKPKKPNFGTFGGVSGGSLEEGSPTYGWDGVRTIQEVGVPIALIYGRHKIGGNIINQYVWNDGDKEYLNLLLALGEGEINSISDIKINENPFENYSGLTKYERYGTNDQSIIEGFEQLHSVNDVSANLLKDSPYTYTTVDQEVETFEVELSCPYGLFESASNGDLLPNEVKYKIEYKLHSSGTWIDLGEQTISASSRTAVRRKFRKDGLEAGQYDIRVTKTSDNSTSMKISDLRLVRVDEIKNDDLAYPNTALLGLKLLATDQLSGATPNVNCIAKGLKIKTYAVMNGATLVPYEDYYWDQATSKFRLLADDTDLSWDGSTYVTAWCANPVWCLYDLIANNRYGLGEYISTTNIDLAQFVEMAKYCDEKVPDGNGGYEKRFELDVVIDSPHTAVDILIQLTSVFRAWAFYSTGTIKIKIDKPENPTQLFGMGNILEGTFQQSWKPVKDVPNVIEVQYLDAQKNYEQEMVAYADESALSENPMRKRTVRLFVTNISRALREARYASLLAKYIHRSISFKASIDAIACQVGDIISVTHDVPNWGQSGRVKGGTISTVVLDQPVTIESGEFYKVRIRHNDDTLEEKTVTNPAGTHSTLTVSGSFTATPAAEEVWAFGKSSSFKKNFRIINMKRDGNNDIEIQAVEYSSLVYDDSAPTIPASNYDDPTAGIPSVQDLVLTERLVKLADGTIQNVIDVWWNKPDTSEYPFKVYDRAKIYISQDNGASYELRGESSGTTFAISTGVQSGVTYKIAVTSVNVLGQEKSISTSPTATLTVQGKSAPPSDVTGFAASFADDHIHFVWNHITDVDLAGYEIRELPYAGADWNMGIPVSSMIADNTYDFFSVTIQGSRYFSIKAIDTTNNYSTNAATATLLIGAIPDINIVEERDFDLALGVLSGDAERIWVKAYSPNYYRTALALKTAEDWSSGGNWDASGKTWDAPVVLTAGEYVTETVDLLGSVDANISLEVGILNVLGGQVTIYIAYSETESMPANWQTFTSGHYTARYIRFKLVFQTTNSDYGITIYKIHALFDVPDKDEQRLGVQVAASGWTTITFNEDFIAVKGLIVSVVGNPYILEHDQSDLPSSFKVKLKDSSGVQQAGSINYYVKGY